MSFIIPGHPRLRLLDTDKVTPVKTLYLPMPDRETGMLMNWDERSDVKALYDGGESCRRLGWLPEVTFSWKYYNDLLRTSQYAIGDQDGEVATIDALLALLDAPPGRLVVSPGPSAGGFVVMTTKLSGIGTNAGIATGVKLTLRGGVIHSSKVLGAF